MEGSRKLGIVRVYALVFGIAYLAVAALEVGLKVFGSGSLVVGSQTILANNATLAGHVHVGDWAIVGGLSGVHQFCHVGAHAMIGFQSHVSQDVPPFMMVDGHPLTVRGFNAEGMRRRGFSAERIAAVKQMHRLLYRDGLTLDDARTRISALAESIPDAADDARLVGDFVASARRGIAR